MSSAFLHVERPLAPRLIEYLYWIALVVIAIGLILGIVGGVRTMSGMGPHRQAMAAGAPANQAAPDAAQATPPANTAMAGDGMRGPGRWRMRRGPGGAMMGPRRFMRRPMMGGWMHNASPPVQGGIRIILALIRALIAWMIIRVLAEIGLAILAMKPRTV